MKFEYVCAFVLGHLMKQPEKCLLKIHQKVSHYKESSSINMTITYIKMFAVFVDRFASLHTVYRALNSFVSSTFVREYGNNPLCLTMNFIDDKNVRLLLMT